MDEFIPLEKDLKWSVFGDHTWESFQDTYLPKFGLIPTVNEEVKKQYRAIRKLMAQSYFEYEFFDIAAAHMSMLMEMAMVWRYEEITREAWNKKVKRGEPKRDLENLFKWLGENGHLNLTHPLDATLLRKTRNYYAHPKKHGFAGGINLSRIKELLFFINELYDPNLTLRNNHVNEVGNWMTANRDSKTLLRMPAGTMPLADLTIAFIDCSEATPHYYFACFPLLKLKEIDRMSPYASQTLLILQLVELKIQDTSLSGVEFLSGTEVKLEQADMANCQLIDDWHNELKTMNEIAAQMPAWRIMELSRVVEELKAKYFNGLSPKEPLK